MALFTSAPEKALQRDLDGARTSRAATAKRLGMAQDKATECEAALQRLASEGAQDPVLVAAEIALDEVERRVSTLEPALAEAEKLVVRLESQLADALDKKVRAETTRQCEQIASRIEKASEAIVPLMAELAAATALADVAQIWDAHGYHVYAQNSALQIPAAAELVSKAVREHGARVLAGMERATLLTPAVPHAAVDATPAEPTTGIYRYDTPKPGRPNYRVSNDAAFLREKN
jgi:hypothetical protein